MIEVIENHIPSDIPTFVREEGMTILKYDMSSSKKVNDALFGLRAQMTGWSEDTILKAHSTFQIDLPIVGAAGPFSLIILWFSGEPASESGGKAFKIFNPSRFPPDPDPTGDIIYGVGPGGSDAEVIGVPVTDGMGQNEIIEMLASKMAEVAGGFTFKGDLPIDDPDNGFNGVNTVIAIEAKVGGPTGNDLGGFGNIIGGGQFNGVTKYGGYDLVSARNADTILKWSMWNGPTSNFTFRAHFLQGPRGNPESRTVTSTLGETVLHKRTNYQIGCGARQVIIFPEVYLPYSPGNITEVIAGTSDYHFCGVYTPPDQANEHIYGVDAIRYAAFMMATPRTILHEQGNCATCVNDTFYNGVFTGIDAGVCYWVLNSRFHDGGALRTTAGKALKYSAFICLSPGNSFSNRAQVPPIAYAAQPTAVYGYVPNMYLTTEAVPFNTRIVDSRGETWMAYRVQTTPCECTLWLGGL